MQIKCGDYVENEKVIDEEDILNFAKFSNDYNPIHFEEQAAQKQGYRHRIVHGMLIGSLFSKIIGTQLPGDGSVYISQVLNFKRPVFVGEKVKIRVEVVGIKDKNVFLLKTSCFNEKGKVAVAGEAEVLLKEV